MTDEAIRALADEAAISRAVARYASVVDWQDWDQLPRIFTADAHFDFGGMFQGGLAEYTPFVAALEGGYDRRMHLMGVPRIDVDGDRARAEAASVIHCRIKGDDAHNDMVFWGRYLFDARREGDGWKLTRLRYLLGAVHASQQAPMDESMINVADGCDPAHAEAPPPL